MSYDNVAVIGGGTMGIDIALHLASFNIKVLLLDKNEDILNKLQGKIEDKYKLYKMFSSRLRENSISKLLECIKFAKMTSELGSCEVIIENVTEDEEVKKAVYKEIFRYCQKDVVIGINTSCISITKLASSFPIPQNVVGIHFMNPVPLKSRVEAIRGFYTSEETMNKIEKFLNKIERKAIWVNDMPGFAANRISHLFMNEAMFVVQDQVASPEAVDEIFRSCYEHKMGPLETADLIGLDTVMNSLGVLYNAYNDPKFRCCPLLRKMVSAGLLGRKTGKGFYNYNY
jgi:3-hydroxybutyryl-CoA dehydrogenase